MKKSKRILALVLVLALAFTSFAMFASADTAEEIQPKAACPLCGTSLKITYPQETTIVKAVCRSFPSIFHNHAITTYYVEEDCTSSSCPYYSFNRASSVDKCMGL